MSVVDVRELQAKGLEPSLRTEIWVTHLLGKLAALGRCPHYLQLHSCFRSASAPPEQWACTGGGGSPSARASAEQDENAPPVGRLRRTARKPARSTGRAGGCYQYVVMQYAEGGDMEEACKALPGMVWPVDQLPHLAFQMLFSLHVAQVELQMRHYDVKLLNFFLTSPAAALGGPAAAVDGPASAARESAGCGEVRLRYSVLGADYLLRLDASAPSLAVLADFGTADISPSTLGAAVAACNFTTLENTPPEFLLCGAAARQGFEADAWGMALCLLHLLTGRAPYEELLATVRCPADLRRSLEAVWAGAGSPSGARAGAPAACGGAGGQAYEAEVGSGAEQGECDGASMYGAVGQVLETDEEGVLADTLYRYLCLFGPETAGSAPLAPRQAAAAGRERVAGAAATVSGGLGTVAPGVGGSVKASPAWHAVERWLFSSPGRSRFGRDHAHWSAFHGRAKPVAEAQRRMAQLPGAEEMLRGLCEFEPSRRWTVEQALGGRMLEPLRAAAAEVQAEGCRPARCFTAYA
jgi:serine/threonine protein kinase